MSATLTPEQHRNDLMTAIEREIERYGVRSLADLIASLLDCRDTDDTSTESREWRKAAAMFENLAHLLPDLKGKLYPEIPQ